MTDWEREISELPWRGPSKALRKRISEIVTTSANPQQSDRQMPIRWAAAIAIATGLSGFCAGLVLHSNAPQVASIVTDVRVVETYRPQNSFDFSGQETQILPGEFKAYVEPPAETQP